MAQNQDLVLHNVSYITGFFLIFDNNNNKSAKLTQITSVVFVVNSMVMTTFWEQIPLIQFFDNSRTIIQEWGIWQVIELEIFCLQKYLQFDKDWMKNI